MTAVLEALTLARWDDLPEASLPWDSVAELARAQGIGEADVVWDLAAGMPTKTALPVVSRTSTASTSHP